MRMRNKEAKKEVENGSKQNTWKWIRKRKEETKISRQMKGGSVKDYMYKISYPTTTNQR